MTNLSYSEAAPLLMEHRERLKKLTPEPIYFYPYLKRVLEERFKAVNPQYPMTIPIAKENKYLLKGDYSPDYVITLEEQLRREDGTPIWFESTANEAFLRLGFKNCDARFISDVKMDMEFIHGFLGGASGHGKSVTLNALLGGLFYEYAPWELEVHMSDAKIVEFKKYGIGHTIPHISTIAATEDADFVISVLQKAFDEMNQRAKIFGNLGVSNLKNFRKKTGLAYPRVLIVMDEVESTFRMAGRKAQKIADLIDGFARLGRAAGYHILMATQNMSADIPKSAIGQIRIRMCLGASQNVSESVLANTAAADNYGRIGRLIVNTDVLNGGNTFPGNVEFQTPYLTDDNFITEMEELESLGAKVSYRPSLAFYDEEDIKTVEKFKPIIDQSVARMSKAGEIGPMKSSVVLGYPAFVSTDPDGLLKVTFDHKDIENVVICSTSTDRVATELHNFDYSLKNSWKMIHYATDSDMFAYTPNAMIMQTARESSQPPLTIVDTFVRRRLFMLFLDEMASNNGVVKPDMEVVEKVFKQNSIPETYWGNGLMCRRASAFCSIQSHPDNYANVWKPVSGFFKNFSVYYKECEKFNAIIDPITTEKFNKVMYFIGDLSKIIGYGRDSKSREVAVLKKAMQDANRAGIVYVLYTRSMEDLTDLKSGLRYAIMTSPDGRDWSRLRLDEPAAISPRLCVLVDTLDTKDPQKKYKRTLLREEF